MSWIRRGLRFECQPDCGKCCTSEREGSVFLEPSDIENMAELLGTDRRRFVERFTIREEGGDLELRRTPDGGCVFLVDRKCTVHASKPLQCRAYPFLPLDGFTPIESAFTWEYEKRYCPGIGKGRLYLKSEIAAIRRGRGGVTGFVDPASGCAHRPIGRKK